MWKLLLFVALVHGAAPKEVNCDVSTILDCMNTYLDRDGDGKLNATEIDLHMLYQPCGPVYTKVMGDSVMTFCDMDGDGYITESDLTYEPVNCASNTRVRMQLCNECDKCQIAMNNTDV